MSLGNLARFVELQRNGTLSPPALERLKARKLQRLVRHAYFRAPFYRRLFDQAGVRPEDVRGMSDLQRLPVLRRADVQGASDMLADGIEPRDCVVRQTGGSTGRPLTVFTHRADLEYEAMGWLRCWLARSMSPRDVQLTIKDAEDSFESERQRWFQKWGLLRIHYVDIYDPVEDIVARIEEVRPDVLRAPPSMLEVIAREAPARPRLIFTTSERLSPRAQRIIERELGAPVHEFYGATEAGCIAWRCRDCGAYHVNSDFLIVEVVDENGQPVASGETGEVVITNLFSRATPFLRYSLGDVCTVDRAQTCPASPEPFAIRSLLGRTVDQLVLTDGRRVSPYQFMPDEVEGILEYLVVQEEPGDVEILVVPNEQFREESLGAKCREYMNDVDHRAHVSFQVVDTLPTPPSGKFRRVLSRAAPTEAS